MTESSFEQPILPGMPEAHARKSWRWWGRGSVRDDGDRSGPDGSRTEPLTIGAPAPGFEDIYAKGIEGARNALEASRLREGNAIKARNMTNALRVIARANQTGGIATVLEAGTTDPHYGDIRHYFRGNSSDARERERLQRSSAKEMIEVACGACALRNGCIYSGNPGVLAGTFRDPEIRARMLEGIGEAKKQEEDFDCMNIILPDSREAHRKRLKR